MITTLAAAAYSLIEWRELPHVDRRTAAGLLFSGAAPASAMGPVVGAISEDAAHKERERVFQPMVPPGGPQSPRTAKQIDNWPAIPVWPAWPTPTSPTGGRVIPMSPDPALADPFLLVAHHRHSFSPNDPLRGPFKTVGGALGLPYVGDEGFKLHPHRGIDILTYVLDGSDGFRHKDSLGGSCTYRGGACQFMRSGKGAMHEEMWETRSDRSTSIELFQIWVNLPSKLKMQPPAIRYLGNEWANPYTEEVVLDSNQRATRVRTIDTGLIGKAGEGEGEVLQQRPPMSIRHVKVPPSGSFVASIERGHNAFAYVRKGTVRLNGQVLGEVNAGSTCFLRDDGDCAWFVNPSKGEVADMLLLTGQPLREPVALGGPIVMNSEAELRRAYQELRAGTFLA